jgi:GNAT superfamily N-acetyltransferase
MPQLNMNDVAIALEVNEAAGVAGSVRESIARTPGGPSALRPMGDGFLIYAGPGAFINRAAGLGMPSEVTDEQLDEVESFYRDLGAIPTVDLCPYAHQTLRRQLRQRGYVIQKFKEVLYRAIGAEEDLSPSLGIDTVQLDREDDEQMNRIATVIEMGFWEGKPPPENRVHNTLRLLRQSAATTFAAVIDGEWVGGGVVATSAGPAALFAASTRPEYRRRGVQAALIRARLAYAQSRGARLATIQCAPGIATRRNAERQGFQCAYTKVEMVLLDREST